MVPPEDVQPLALVQPQHLVRVHLQGPGVAQRLALLQRQEVHVVGAVDGGWYAEDVVGHGLAAAHLRVVLNVVDAVANIRQLLSIIANY